MKSSMSLSKKMKIMIFVVLTFCLVMVESSFGAYGVDFNVTHPGITESPDIWKLNDGDNYYYVKATYFNGYGYNLYCWSFARYDPSVGSNMITTSSYYLNTLLSTTYFTNAPGDMYYFMDTSSGADFAGFNVVGRYCP